MPPTSTLLSLMWLASPALPIGGFSYSEGIEAAVDGGWVHDEATAAPWLHDQLALTLARSDLPALRAAVEALRAGDEARLHGLNQWVLQTRESAELRAQTVQMGRSMWLWLQSLQGDCAPPSTPALRVDEALVTRLGTLTYPVAFALASAARPASREASLESLLAAYAFGWAENMIAAAIKAVPLGQSAGQRLLERLSAAIPATVDQALSCGDAERQALSPRLAILSAQHEAQYSRLFRS